MPVFTVWASQQAISAQTGVNSPLSPGPRNLTRSELQLVFAYDVSKLGLFPPVDSHKVKTSSATAAWFDLGYLTTQAQRPSNYLEILGISSTKEIEFLWKVKDFSFKEGVHKRPH